MSLQKIVVAGVAFSFVVTAWASGEHQNITGLPTYPHQSEGDMDATFRSLPNGQHCIRYTTDTDDPLVNVEDWYKKQLPAAQVEDINYHSMFGSYFKLNGIKLIRGNDLVNIYANISGPKTTIELYKCKNAPGS